MQTDLIIINDFATVAMWTVVHYGTGRRTDRSPGDWRGTLPPTSQLAELERYTHLYYDLSINIAGIDAIHHMLERIELLQQEVRSLRNELEFYR